MNLNQLSYVLAVVECGSFSKASIKCNVTQPTLSNGIASLENEFGGQIFNRTTRRTELSAFGSQILPCIKGSPSGTNTAKGKCHCFPSTKKAINQNWNVSVSG